jgi:hypothetical protein
VGTAAYAQEFTSARRRLLAAFGNGIEVVHGPPVLEDGVNNCKGVFAILDLFDWLKHCTGSKRDIIVSRDAGIELIKKNLNEESTGSPLAPVNTPGTPLAPEHGGGSPLVPPSATPLAAVSYHLYMPSDIEKKGLCVFEVTHKMASDTVIDNISSAQIYMLINTMIDELNEKFSSGLGHVGDLQCSDEDEQTESSPFRLIFVGGSRQNGGCGRQTWARLCGLVHSRFQSYRYTRHGEQQL